MPPGMTHEEHLAQMKKDAEMKQRGTEAMGFDQDTTTHHFRLTETGGVIEVSVNDVDNTAGRDQIAPTSPRSRQSSRMGTSRGRS